MTMTSRQRLVLAALVAASSLLAGAAVVATAPYAVCRRDCCSPSGPDADGPASGGAELMGCCCLNVPRAVVGAVLLVVLGALSGYACTYCFLWWFAYRDELFGAAKTAAGYYVAIRDDDAEAGLGGGGKN